MLVADPNTTPTTTPPLGAGQIEIWKKIVDVQQHFNDLELRIRNFALIVTGAFLGLGGYAIKDAGIVRLFGLEVSIAGLVVVSAIFPLAAFYFMDRLWYHRLLDGSVYAGISAEKALVDMGYSVDLGSKIKEHSPFKLWFTESTRIYSKTKMDLFYAILASSLLIVAGFLGFGIRPQPTLLPSAAAPVTTKGGTVLATPRIAATPALPALSVDTTTNAAAVKGSVSRPDTQSR